MKKEILLVAFSNQKGGVGKSAFTTLVASHFHYTAGKNVLVVDCDFPQHSLFGMRERDILTVEKSDYLKNRLIAQFETIQKKAYTILKSEPENAIAVATRFLDESETDYDVVFFDLPGTVNSMGIFKSVMNMDYIFTPVICDRMAIQSSLAFVTTVQDYLKGKTEVPLKGLYVFWNNIDKRVSSDVFDMYSQIMSRLHLNVMETVIPATSKYSKELSIDTKTFFRSTLFPPTPKLLKGSGFDQFVEEIGRITQLT